MVGSVNVENKNNNYLRTVHNQQHSLQYSKDQIVSYFLNHARPAPKIQDNMARIDSCRGQACEGVLIDTSEKKVNPQK